MKFFFVLSFFLSSSVFAQPTVQGVSAQRQSQETYEEARNKALFQRTFQMNLHAEIWADPAPVTRGPSVERSKKSLSEIDLSTVPELSSYETLEALFQHVRDKRFLPSPHDSSFPRRLTWLYPDDGCFARAEMAKNEFEDMQVLLPKKVFVFGNLYAQSTNTVSGHVAWWYHVAVTYRVGPQVYVMDPSLEPRRPLMLEEWDQLVGGANTFLQYSFCSKDAYDPTSDCEPSRAQDKSRTLFDQKSFLQPEWSRLLTLQRNPQAELGEAPPWLIPPQKP